MRFGFAAVFAPMDASRHSTAHAADPAAERQHTQPLFAPGHHEAHAWSQGGRNRPDPDHATRGAVEDRRSIPRWRGRLLGVLQGASYHDLRWPLEPRPAPETNIPRAAQVPCSPYA